MAGFGGGEGSGGFVIGRANSDALRKLTGGWSFGVLSDIVSLRGTNAGTNRGERPRTERSNK